MSRGQRGADVSGSEGNGQGSCGAPKENCNGIEKKENKKKDGRSVWKHWSARKDMKLLMDTGTTGKEKKSRKHFEDDTLHETVRYILQSNNIQLLSWGTRRLYVDGQRRQFPVLVRKASIDVMWRNYARDRCNYPAAVKKVRRTLFCDIASKLTRGDVKQRDCIEYKLHGLVYENAKLLRRIVDDHVLNSSTRKQLTKKMKGVCEFLKYSYITHLDDSHSDPFYDTKYSLGHGKYNEDKRKGECIECNAVFKFLEELKAEIIDLKAEIIDLSHSLDTIIVNAGKKFGTYMGHIVRKHVQEQEISRVFEWIRDGEANHRVAV